MIGKLSVALAAPFLLSAQPAPEFVENPYVHQVRCSRSLGTAFRVGLNTLVSVKHVTSNTGCVVEGVAADMLYSTDSDFSIARSPLGPGGIPISCEGFVPGQRYRALGYANGLPRIRQITVYATGFNKETGLDVLTGMEKFIPGMSGGPVLDDFGRVVGTVNAFNSLLPLSFSKSLRDTPLCEQA